MSRAAARRQQFPLTCPYQSKLQTRSPEQMGVVDAGLAEGSDAQLLELSLPVNAAWEQTPGHTHRRFAPSGRPQF